MMQLLLRPAILRGDPKCSPVEQLISLGYFWDFLFFGRRQMDDLSDLAYEANGLLVIFAAGAFVMYLIYQFAASPNVLQSLANISPWLASNAKTLAWVAMGLWLGERFSFRSPFFFYRANCLVPGRFASSPIRGFSEMSQQSRISVRKSPFDAAKRKGVEAAHAGLPISACPYKDKTTATGGRSWSRSFINDWLAGHQSVSQGDLFSQLMEPFDLHLQEPRRACSTVEHSCRPVMGVSNE